MANLFAIEKDRHQLIFSFRSEGLELTWCSMFEPGFVKVIIPNVHKADFIAKLDGLESAKYIHLAPKSAILVPAGFYLQLVFVETDVYLLLNNPETHIVPTPLLQYL